MLTWWMPFIINTDAPSALNVGSSVTTNFEFSQASKMWSFVQLGNPVVPLVGSSTDAEGFNSANLRSIRNILAI
jgi:hypothetical protein